jgi:hypothetical protein
MAGLLIALLAVHHRGSGCWVLVRFYRVFTLFVLNKPHAEALGNLSVRALPIYTNAVLIGF